MFFQTNKNSQKDKPQNGKVLPIFHCNLGHMQYETRNAVNELKYRSNLKCMSHKID